MGILAALLAVSALAPSPGDSLVQRLEKYTTCYAEQMRLTPTWRIAVQFERVETGDGLTHSAGAQAWPGYYLAIVTYDTALVKLFTDVGLRELVVHELLHVQLWELTELASAGHAGYARRLNEQVVTRMARQPVWQTLCR